MFWAESENIVTKFKKLIYLTKANDLTNYWAGMQPLRSDANHKAVFLSFAMLKLRDWINSGTFAAKSIDTVLKSFNSAP